MLCIFSIPLLLLPSYGFAKHGNFNLKIPRQLMIILVYHLYEGIMIRIGTDDVEYDSLGNRSYLSKKSLNIILGLIMGVIGSIFRFKGLFSPADIILLFIGCALIVYSLLFVDSSDNYDIRKRASSSEFYQRKDLSSGIYS